MSIEVKGVNKRFGQFTALNDINLNIQSGELVALLPQWRGIRADFHLLYSERARESARIRQFVDFMTAEMAGRVPALP